MSIATTWRILHNEQRHQMIADFAPIIFPELEAEGKEQKRAK